MISNPVLQSHPRPIIKTIPCPNLSEDYLKTVIVSRTGARKSLNDIASNSSLMAEEIKLLNTLLYKNHNRFRNDKGYKTLRMLEKNTAKFLSLNFMTVTTDFLQLVPASPAASNICLPSLAMCQYCQLLVCQATAVVSKAETIARVTGLLNVQRVNLGHFWGVAGINLASVARLWVLLRNVILKLKLLYRHLGTMSDFFPGDSAPYTVPKDLSEFLSPELNAVDMEKEYEEKVIKSSEVLSVEDFLDLDLGEPVKRNVVELQSDEDVNSVPKKRRVEVDDTSKEVKKDFLSDLHTLDEMKLFLENETRSRKTSKKTSLTRKLSQDQWKTLKKEVLNTINPSKPNKSIKLCRKIIRNTVKLK